MDLDNFKTVNDLKGHEGGDEVLRQVAQALRKHTRQSDVVARLGGDEFVALFPETGSVPAREAVQKVLGQLLGAMRKGNWPVTFSIGAVTFECPMNTVRETLKLADDLMYAAKKDGKNSIRYAVWKDAVVASDTIHGLGTVGSPREDSE
jgi:diguanylate cyclase (GGDEF)-like protein